MKKNNLKKLIKKIIKEQSSIDDIPFKPTPPGPPPPPPPGQPGEDYKQPDSKDVDNNTPKRNLSTWKIISATPNYSGQTPQNRYSTTCPPKKVIGTYTNVNKFKSIARKKKNKKRGQ